MELKRNLLLTALLFLAQASLAGGPSHSVSSEARDVGACAKALQFRQQFDVNEGVNEIEKLHELNDALALRESNGTLTREWVLENLWRGQNIARLSDDAVSVHGPDLPEAEFLAAQSLANAESPNALEKAPFRRLDLPFAHTGIYIPKGPIQPQRNGATVFNARDYDGIIIALPGIGFSISVAKSLFELSGTLSSGKHPELKVSGNKALRLLTCPLDPPLNGLAENAPYGWGHPLAILEVVRHSRLILSALFPGKKIGIVGRSQGGATAVEYASYYSDIVGALGLNPSHPDPVIVEKTIKIHEDMALPENRHAASAAGFDINFHIRSWSAHADFTGLYGFVRQPSLVPVKLQFSRGDWGYPQELYAPAWENWVSQDTSLRSRDWFDGPHNLWRKPHKPRAKGLPSAEQAQHQIELDRHSAVIKSLAEFFAPLFLGPK